MKIRDSLTAVWLRFNCIIKHQRKHRRSVAGSDTERSPQSSLIHPWSDCKRDAAAHRAQASPISGERAASFSTKQAPLFITRPAQSAENGRAESGAPAQKGTIKELCQEPVGRHGEHGPLEDLFRHVDVLLARDGDLLRLVFEELDVVVDVEDVFVELGEVVELRGQSGGGGCLRFLDGWKSCQMRTEESRSLTSFLMVSSRLSPSSSFWRL